MSTTLKLGYTNPLTDIFGAHPLLGSILDLNDGATFTLTYPDGLELPPPPRTLVTAGNIRTQGEKATRAIYRHNREVRAGLILGPMSNYANLVLLASMWGLYVAIVNLIMVAIGAISIGKWYGEGG